MFTNTKIVSVNGNAFLIDFNEGRVYRWLDGSCIFKETGLTKDKDGYFQMNIDGRTKLVSRFIMQAYLGNEIPVRMEVDHQNGVRTDNRISNLRLLTRQQNQQNTWSRPNSFSKFKGVCWHKASNKYIAKLRLNHKDKHLGSFENEIDAAHAYNREAMQLNALVDTDGNRLNYYLLNELWVHSLSGNEE